MKIKLVKQYCCDFCKKKRYTVAAMNKHESHCTLNPNRKCRVCEKISGDDTPNLTGPQMVAMLPNINDFGKQTEWGIGVDVGKLHGALKEKIQPLRDAVDNCPACLLAAFRQSGIGIPLVGEDIFNYSDDMKEFWDNYNADQQDFHAQYGGEH